MKNPTQLAFYSIPSRQVDAGVTNSKSKLEMIEIGGRLAQLFGMPRSTGQIFGLLYFSSRPLNLADICDMLGISKASTSTGTRQLVIWGAIRKVWIPGERRDYYEAISDLMQLFTGSYKAIVKPRVNSTKNRLQKIEETLDYDVKMQLLSKEEEVFIRERIVALKKIHGRVTNVLPILEKFLNLKKP